MRIERWITASHLDAGTIATRRGAFEQNRFRSAVLDDFLLPGRHAALQSLFAEDGDFEDFRGRRVASSTEVLQAGGKAFYEYRVKTEAGWSRVADENRLAHELLLAGPRPGREQSPGWTTHVELEKLFRSEVFADFLETLTGIRTGGGLQWMPRIMRPGHFVRPHDDTGGRRRLCMVYFVGDGWLPGFGARFQNVVAGEVVRSIEPIANRVIIHEPRLDQIHQVEPFAPAAARWERQAYSVWMFGPEA